MNHYTTVGTRRTMLRNDLHLNTRLLSVFSRPDARSALRRMPTLCHQHDRTLHFVCFEELNSLPADSCASLFSTCMLRSLFSFFFALILKVDGKETIIAVATIVCDHPQSMMIFSRNSLANFQHEASFLVDLRDLMTVLSMLSS